MATVNVMSSVSLRRRSATAERRRSSRMSQITSARVSSLHASGYFAGYATTGGSVKIQIHDLSRGGAGFSCNQLLDSGKSYRLEMASSWMQAGNGFRVLWCRERLGGTGFEGGGEFC